MILFATILTWLVGLEHLYIAWLEMKAGVDKQAETFNLPTTYLQQPEAKVSMANQGIYNGMLGLLLLLTTFIFHGATQLNVWLMLISFVVVVAFYGGLTVGKKVWLLQLLPALCALIVLIVSKLI